MESIDTALMISLGIELENSEPKIVEKEVVKEVPVEVVKEVIMEVPVCNSEEIIAAKAQVEQLQAMYNSLLERLITPPKRGRKKEDE